MNNYNIINEYNITYNNSRNIINQIYNNSEFIQEYENIRLIQEYENELIRERELIMLNRQMNTGIQELVELYTHILELQQGTNANEIEIEENERINNERINNERINSYLQSGDEFIETCSICLDDVEHIESTSKLSCGHHFHTNCIRQCLEINRKCPLCRRFCL